MALIDTLGEIPDPRRGNAQRHELLDILAIALVASVCGAESCVDFAEFAEDRETLLREFLSLKNGLPSHDTFSRVFRLLDPAAFGRAFEAFLDDLGAAGDGVLAIDGKTLRRSFDRAAGRSALHVVTAFGTGARVAIAQRAVPEGAERDPRRPRAARDAGARRPPRHRRRDARPRADTAQVILDAGGDYLFALKANRPAMLREVEAFFADPPEPLDGLRDHRRRPWPHRDPAPPGNPFHRLALLRPPLPGRAPPPGPRHPRLRRGDPHRGRPHQPLHPLLPLLRAPHPRDLRPRRPRPLGDREQPALGARRHLRRGPRPQPPRQRPREPRHPPPPHPQPAQQGTARRCPSPENASDPDGPTPSQEPSSAKCDSRAASRMALGLDQAGGLVRGMPSRDCAAGHRGCLSGVPVAERGPSRMIAGAPSCGCGAPARAAELPRSAYSVVAGVRPRSLPRCCTAAKLAARIGRFDPAAGGCYSAAGAESE